ncbi:NAD(P)H-dependent oxidoreductase [Antrihabitans sp. YC2-6]|uniref:NAD(P)H-dependent oxidoreductase n=1 Tax=Antrihabitans sp. YC2-6 TaxID=2799498 RepID=UPI0018F6F84F|nr:NAD(P)H-dependent oxidoreductase [Antrihabitans sp. YC2-6]MBJ8343487.1 NAD(P)H-dependent oxidoreductase [Antrihabitans sp. YC2-6]
MTQSRVLALVGSLRSGAVSRQLADTASHVAPAGTEVVVFEGLENVPFYNPDIDDADAPIPAVEALRSAAGAADALLLVTPEYNGTIPAVLKNAIDWISRPYGNGAVAGKPVAVISSSPSQNGAQWAHADTRKAVGVAGGRVLEDVSISVGGTGAKFGDKHPRENAEVAGQIAGIVTELVSASRGELLSA